MKIDASTVRVEIEERHEDALGAAASLFVTVYALPALGLDRDHVYGWSVGLAGSKKSEALAGRLRSAVLAGAVLGVGDKAVDVNGRSYLSCSTPSKVSGRRMNADLLRLGF